MPLEITESSNKGIVTLKLKGRLAAGESSSFVEKINQLAAAGRLNIVLDVSEVDYLDSAELGKLVSCFTTLKKQGGELKVVLKGT
jgi:anti-anti-sigma factor